MRENIPQYQLKDYSREIVSGSFYQNQLIKAYEREAYMIEKVIRSRRKGNKKEYLVRWKGWKPEFDSWISGQDMKKFKKSCIQLFILKVDVVVGWCDGAG